MQWDKDGTSKTAFAERREAEGAWESQMSANGQPFTVT